MEARSGLNNTAVYDISSLLQGSTTQVTPTSFNDAMFQLITSASSVRNSSLASFAGSTEVESTVKNFYFVMTNGLGNLRTGAENDSLNYYNFYYDDLNTFNIDFAVMMACGIACLLFFEFLLIPIVFSVQRTNNKVLSLFGYIPISDINELANKCERFMANNLEERTEKRDNSFEKSREEDEEALNRSEEEDEGEEENEVNSSRNNVNTSYVGNSHDESMTNNVNATINTEGEGIEGRMKAYKPGQTVGSPANQMLVSANRNLGIPSVNMTKSERNMTKSERNMTKSDRPKNKNANETGQINMNASDHQNIMINSQADMVQEQKAIIARKEREAERQQQQNEEAEADALAERSMKLLNSKDSNKWRIVFQFLFVGVLFMGYFIADYVIEVVYIRNVRQSYEILQLLAMRTSNMKFVHVFNQEELATNARIYDANSKSSFLFAFVNYFD